MLFERDFWGGADMFGRLAPSNQERGKFFLFYSYTGISGVQSVTVSIQTHHQQQQEVLQMQSLSLKA